MKINKIITTVLALTLVNAIIFFTFGQSTLAFVVVLTLNILIVRKLGL